MPNNQKKTSKQLTLAIHSTDNSYCFASREKNNNQSDTFLMNLYSNGVNFGVSGRPQSHPRRSPVSLQPPSGTQVWPICARIHPKLSK